MGVPAHLSEPVGDMKGAFGAGDIFCTQNL